MACGLRLEERYSEVNRRLDSHSSRTCRQTRQVVRRHFLLFTKMNLKGLLCSSQAEFKSLESHRTHGPPPSPDGVPTSSP